LALVELSVVEQRYWAVLEAAAGVPVSEVAAYFGVSRQSVHAWIRRYAEGGLGGLMDRSRRPESCPHQVSAEVEAAVCELRREHPRWARCGWCMNWVRPVLMCDRSRSLPIT
jgi:transposase